MPVLSRPVALGLMIVTTILWGFAFVAQKTAMDNLGPLGFASARYILGGLLVLPLGLIEYRNRRKRAEGADPMRGHWGALGLLCAAFFLGSWLQQAGVAQTSVTNGGFLTGLYVLFVPAIALLALGQKPHGVVYAGVPLALFGIFLLNGARLDGLNAGDGLVIASAVFWAIQVLTVSHVGRRTGLPVFISAISFCSAGLLAGALSLVLEAPTIEALGRAWIEILYAGVLSTAVAFTFQAIAQQYVPPANAAIILSAESLFAAIGGAWLLGERLSAVGYAGALLIFAAIVMVEAVPARAARKVRRTA